MRTIIVNGSAAVKSELELKGYVSVKLGFGRDPFYQVERVGWCVMKQPSLAFVIG